MEEVFLVYSKVKGQKKELIAFTFDNDLFDLYIEQRKNKKSYKYRVAWVSDYPSDYFTSSDNINKELMYECGYAITQEEFEYFAEAWGQYQSDVIGHIENFFKHIQFFKFNKKEKAYIKTLVNILTEYYNAYTHAGIDECDPEDGCYNMEEVMRFFVDYLL